MKLLYFTDVHLTNKCPIGRKEGIEYFDTILDKLRYIGEYAKTENVDFILQGGDFFDTTDIPSLVVKRVVDVLSLFPKPIISLIGNHEIKAIGDIDESWIGILTQYNILPFNVWQHKQPNSLYLDSERDGKQVTLTCGHYYKGIEESLRINPVSWSREPDDNELSILMVHANITPKPCVFEHVSYDELTIKQDIILCSHYHPQGGITLGKHGQVFVSPGALTRISRGHDDINRVPSFVVIDTDKLNVELIQVPISKTINETFDIDSKLISDKREQYIQELVSRISIPNFKANDPLGMLEAAAIAEGVSDDVRDKSIEYLRRYV